MKYENNDGVFDIYYKKDKITQIPSMGQFIKDLACLIENTHDSANKSFCNNRLEILSEKFRMHLL